MKMLMYGGGSIGRGFIAPIFSQAGYQVVFVDINENLVGQLNETGSYTLKIVDEEKEEVLIENISAVSGLETGRVVDLIAECDVMATSLGGTVLERVSAIIGKGFAKRMEGSKKPLDILICENLKDSSKLLRQWIGRNLTSEQAELSEEKLGLVEAAIGRMVPVVATDEGTTVAVERYDFLPVDKDGFKGEIPNVKQLVPYSPFSFYEERKLYLHNMGHAVCGFIGALWGDEFIWQATANPWTKLFVQSAMTESAEMLSVKYTVPFHEIFVHGEGLMKRFQNKALGDTCERVIRDPMRKLGPDDRLIAPLRLCEELGIPTAYLDGGVALAVYSLTKDKNEAARVLTEHCGLKAGVVERVVELHSKLSKLSLEEYYSHIENLKYGMIKNRI